MSGPGVTMSTQPAPPPAPRLAPDTMVGEYRIERPIGEGGMGCVYAATHPVIAKRAAIKVLNAEFSVNPVIVERFIQEARSVNQIGHPNIVDIFSFGVLPDGRRYLVMEHLKGESLRTRVRKGRIPMAEVFEIVEAVAGALEAAHATGIVHRDLKPDNIFLVDARPGAARVKLLDFGIAKLLGDDEQQVRRTQTGNVMGTPAYMSPEQARGHGVDHRTDIYALGAMFYEMLAGSLPYPANNAADMISMHLHATVPLAREKNTAVPAELDRFIATMMSKDSSARPTLAQLLALLATFRRNSGMMSSISVHEQTLPAYPIEQPVPTPVAATPQFAGQLPTVGPARTRPFYVVAIVAIAAIVGLVVTIVIVKSGPSQEAAPTTTPAAAPSPPDVAPAPAAIVPADAAIDAAPVITIDAAPAKIEKPVKPRPRPLKHGSGSSTEDDDDAPMR